MYAYAFSLFSEVRPLQGRGKFVLQSGNDRAIVQLVDNAVLVATRLLRQEFQSGWLLRLTLVRSYPDGHFAAGFRRLSAVSRRDRHGRGLHEFRDGARRGILGYLAPGTNVTWTTVCRGRARD